MTCEHCRDKFTELHDGAIVGEQADAVRAHIATCPQCEREYHADRGSLRPAEQDRRGAGCG